MEEGFLVDYLVCFFFEFSFKVLRNKYFCVVFLLFSLILFLVILVLVGGMFMVLMKLFRMRREEDGVVVEDWE